MVTIINESKTLTKHISCQCKNVNLMKQNVSQSNDGITINVDVSIKTICEKDYVWNPATCSCENGKYLASILDDSAVIYDEVIKLYDEEIQSIPTSFNETNITCKTQNFYIYLSFY